VPRGLPPNFNFESVSADAHAVLCRIRVIFHFPTCISEETGCLQVLSLYNCLKKSTAPFHKRYRCSRSNSLSLQKNIIIDFHPFLNIKLFTQVAYASRVPENLCSRVMLACICVKSKTFESQSKSKELWLALFVKY
jgi:hypothetical protein